MWIFLASLSLFTLVAGQGYQEDPCMSYDHQVHGQRGICAHENCCPYNNYISGLCPTQPSYIRCCFSTPTCLDQSQKAVWISVYRDNTTPQETATAFAELASIGVTRVYVSVWHNGLVYFNSPTMTNLIGSAGFARDSLQWAVDEAKKNGMEIYAWYEYGLMASWGGPDANAFSRYARDNGWVRGEARGWTWLIASHTDVLYFMSDIINDAINNYPGLDGVQLDDHFAQPSEFGYLRGTMTTAAEHVLKNVPQGMVSLSPSPMDWSRDNNNVDWEQWYKDDIGFFEYVPQLYYTTYSAFSSELTKTINRLGKDWLLSGIRVNGSGAPTAWSEVVQMLDRCHAEGIAYSIWYSEGVLDTYPSQFKNYW
ncbi:uncharacterized protein [Ptychodera flava]|uniref:uncharacterized protein n=1 Tax=Ptychodera flava TaxID=63121 RepID=UPI003969C54B